MNKPTKIKLINKETLRIVWDDGEIYDYPVKYLRDESPDAANKGESTLGQQPEQLNKGEDKPGKYEIEKIEIVGGYAINIYWKDGVSDGIYSYELLRKWGKYFSVVENLHQDFEHHHEGGHE